MTTERQSRPQEKAPKRSWAFEPGSAGRLPAFVYDLTELDAHAKAVKDALGDVELYYAVKANPDAELLKVLARHVDGFEVSSGGELAHVRGLHPDMPVALGGPGKTDEELLSPVTRLHVESTGELRRLIASGRSADVLLRVNLDLPVDGAALAMGGGATPFGMDPGGIAECLELLGRQHAVRLRGIHAHLASGLDAHRMLELAAATLDYVRGLGLVEHGVGPSAGVGGTGVDGATDVDGAPGVDDTMGFGRSARGGRATGADQAIEINLGGGMSVSYTDPDLRFDWQTYGRGLAELRRPGEVLRVEPGRSLTVYCGRYVTRVIDVKRVHGELFAVVAGGTHHIRTPATRGHSQPMVIAESGEPTTIVGQLCTPKDVLARRVPVGLKPGDVVEFTMAGAYAWNISHHDFLMHPKPGFHYIGE